MAHISHAGDLMFHQMRTGVHWEARMRLVAQEYDNVSDAATVNSWREEMEEFHANHAAKVHKSNIFEEPLLGIFLITSKIV